MIPEALVVHKTDNRLRIRIPSKKGDAVFFEEILSAFSGSGFDTPFIKAETGSILFEKDGIDGRAVAEFARKNDLFRLDSHIPDQRPVAWRIAEPIGRLSEFLSKYTVGQLDMPSLAFLILLAVGIREIATGNFKSPPWYTAFWYAFGVFSKSVADKAKAYEREKKDLKS